MVFLHFQHIDEWRFSWLPLANNLEIQIDFIHAQAGCTERFGRQREW
jgi:hypothetical protein